MRVEATTAPCAASGSDLDCNLGDLEAGQEVVVAVTGMVSASPDLLLTNRVRASSATFDPDEDNNFDAEFTCTNASCFVTTLSGANEVPPVTTPGSGKAQVAIDTATDEVCWGYLVRGLTSPVVGAHIHDGDVGVNGPIVVDLSSPAPDADGVSTGCVVDPDGDAIAADPTGHYINVHTTMNPGGEVREQLAAPP